MCGAPCRPFDMVTALEQWIEHGNAPDQIIAARSTNNVVDRTRPLCPDPQNAVYKGAGSIDEAANFVCRARLVIAGTGSEDHSCLTHC
jgi:feruloyl esterase